MSLVVLVSAIAVSSLAQAQQPLRLGKAVYKRCLRKPPADQVFVEVCNIIGGRFGRIVQLFLIPPVEVSERVNVGMHVGDDRETQ